MSSSSRWALAVAGIAGAALALGVFLRGRGRRTGKGKAMLVTGLYIYPIKSCAGVAVTKAVVQGRGFVHDREWMLVDAASKRFVSQRKYPQLALVQVRVEEAAEELVVQFRGGAEERVAFAREGASEVLSVTVWDDTCEALDQGERAAEWFSEVVGAPVRLVRMRPTYRRQTSLKYSLDGDQVGFADGFPFLIATDASLEQLQQWAGPERELGMARFRPNIRIDGGEPFEEERWTRIIVNGTEFRLNKRCERCKTTTVDQDKGTYDTDGIEPLTVIRAHRKQDGRAVFFGMNAVQERSGDTLEVGDHVSVLGWRD